MFVFAEFFQKYFADPILFGGGYNPYNTLAYAALFVAFLYLIFKIIEKLNVRVDREFLVAMFPFVVLGSLLRTLEDKTHVSYFLKTPFIYFLITAAVLLLLVASLLIERKLKVPYFLILLSAGVFACLVVAKRFVLAETLPLLFSASLSLATLCMLMLAGRWKKFKMLSLENILLIATHVFDASTTYAAVKFFNYGEQHVLANFLISAFGAESLFLLKLAVLLPLLYVIDREMKNRDERNFVKFAIFVLGFAPGTRNLLTVSTEIV